MFRKILGGGKKGPFQDPSMRKPYFGQKRGRGADIAPSGSWELTPI